MSVYSGNYSAGLGGNFYAFSPILAAATSGTYASLTGQPNLEGILTSVEHLHWALQPSLAPVATGQLALVAVATSGKYADVSGTPALAPVATGSYGSLTNAPVATVYNAGTATNAIKFWSGSGTTTSGVCTFCPTVGNASGATPLFTSILNVQQQCTSTQRCFVFRQYKC